MATLLSDMSLDTQDVEKTVMPTVFSDVMGGLGINVEECDPISDGDFRMLMILVVIAAVVFGCIVHGWLL